MSVEVLEKELEKIKSFIIEKIEKIVSSKTLINEAQKNNYITEITSSIGSLINAKNNVLYEIIKKNYNLYKQTIATILNYLDSYIDDDIIVLKFNYIKFNDINNKDEEQEYKLLYNKDEKNYMNKFTEFEIY